MDLGSTSQPNLALVACGTLTQGGTPVWETQSGFTGTISRTAAGNYVVETEQPGSMCMVSIRDDAAVITAAAPATVWGAQVDATHFRIKTDVNTAGTGALADVGHVCIQIWRVLN